MTPVEAVALAQSMMMERTQARPRVKQPVGDVYRPGNQRQ
jgi:hypothetical protein